MGRPLKEIDADTVFKLAQLGCTQEEIGRFVGCSHTTIQNRFLQEYELGRGSQVISLRRWQMKKARSGCTTMLIHMGKVHLGQTDRLDLTSGDKPIKYVDRANNPRDVVVSHADGDSNGNGVAP